MRTITTMMMMMVATMMASLMSLEKTKNRRGKRLGSQNNLEEPRSIYTIL